MYILSNTIYDIYIYLCVCRCMYEYKQQSRNLYRVVCVCVCVRVCIYINIYTVLCTLATSPCGGEKRLAVRWQHCRRVR